MIANPTEARLRRLLDVSGPVPWSAKGPLLESLAEDPDRHALIWRAVRDGVADVFGRVDAGPAGQLLARLGEPPGDVEASELARALHDRATGARPGRHR